ncbi:Mog1p/PsbP-like protein, partial [Dendrothele bispora CBS 962.96]
MPLQLFGGAITTEAPHNLIDASDIRQVPDTQEVFLFPNSAISIIVEVLQRVEPADSKDAVKFHFDSLAHDNSATSSEVLSVDIVPNDRGDLTPSAVLLSGFQTVTKFNRTAQDQVRILMALYRVEDRGIDLVVTFNVPVTSQDGGAVDSNGFETARQQFDTFVRSLRIVDFGLFA